MHHTPTEVFHYTDSGGQSDAIYLSKSSTILHAAKKDLQAIIQLQVRKTKVKKLQINESYFRWGTTM